MRGRERERVRLVSLIQITSNCLVLVARTCAAKRARRSDGVWLASGEEKRREESEREREREREAQMRRRQLEAAGRADDHSACEARRWMEEEESGL